jgi:hypothetical protein
MRHSRRVRQDIPPLWRVAHDAAMAGARFELTRQRSDLRFELCRSFASCGIATGCLRQTLMRERQRQQIRDASSEIDVGFGESV